MPGCCPLLMWCALCVCVYRTSRLPCCSPCPSLRRSAPHHRTTTLTMMTCRLLCALLVLALCCCPSVCVTVDGEDTGARDPIPTPPKHVNQHGEPQESITVDGVLQAGSRRNSEDGSRNNKSTPPKEEKKSVKVLTPNTEASVAGQAGPVDINGHVAKENVDPLQGSDTVNAGQDVKRADTEIKTNTTKNTTRTNAPTTSTTTKTTAPEAPSNTAMNTEAPTTTTTTTTTTTEAPIITSTEAPTTTTTRAPSHLREIDGSLSSSAWVCAPLLLAVSALAYTTLG
ncbi:hypothetical protein ECC02_011011 [Trypanosoma cruzi]|uniref:Mucin TcMUCII n=1 Tax=Trypanosoma cruzi TaxID=5693 RepID=A0A7J6XQG2_TRYCR|nr:hypothetical protein ECC02_011011 [Trypanosoma cruzi]